MERPPLFRRTVKPISSMATLKLTFRSKEIVNIQEINEQVGRGIWCRGVSMVCWQGEAALASVEGLVVCDRQAKEPQVVAGRGSLDIVVKPGAMT